MNATLIDLPGRADRKPLLRLMKTFSLSKSETGRLFGVSRQAVDEWIGKGLPPTRAADVARVADLARALHARFIPDRIPQIVRAPMPGLENHSILETIRLHGTVRVFDMLDRAFSYIP